jgi:uncharacterized membrane protein YcaP (DUF421 family)
MEHLIGVDWARAFLPDTPILEIVLRGTCVYLALFVMLRVVLKRETSGMGITDVLVVVLIADAAQNAMAGAYTSVPDGLLLVATIIFWSYALNWLGHRFPRIERIVHPQALPLIEDGRLLHARMREELLTEEELKSQLRLQGVADLSEVKVAYMEGDGRISVISKEKTAADAAERQS